MFELARFGSLHVGGRRLVVSGQPPERVTYSNALRDVPYDPNGTFWIEQAYLQFFIPARLRFSTPLLLVHGGGLTGAIWESTPDGRPGWLQRFVGAGIATYVIDATERGRAGFSCHEGVWPGPPIIRSDEEAWSLYRFGEPAGFADRIAYPGQQFPVEALDALTKATVPRWPANGPRLLAGLEAAVDRIGPCVLLGHSQGGGLAMSAALSRPDLVRSCLLVEPHGLAQEMSEQAVRERGLLLVEGDYFAGNAFWQELSASARTALDAWRQAGGAVEILALPERGIFGNSHMPMMDHNSDAVADLLIDWLDRMHAAQLFA